MTEIKMIHQTSRHWSGVQIPMALLPEIPMGQNLRDWESVKLHYSQFRIRFKIYFLFVNFLSEFLNFFTNTMISN